MNTATIILNLGKVVPPYTQIFFWTTPFADSVFLLRYFLLFGGGGGVVQKYPSCASHLQRQHFTTKNSEQLVGHESSASSPEFAPFRLHLGLPFTSPNRTHRTDRTNRMSLNLVMRSEFITLLRYDRTSTCAPGCRDNTDYEQNYIRTFSITSGKTQNSIPILLVVSKMKRG